MSFDKILTGASALALLAATAGCTDSGDGGGGGTQGTLSLQVTDAPVDEAEHVWVEFGAIELKPAGGASVTFEPETAGRVDLLALSGGEAEALLEEVDLPAGQYNWIRLHDLAVTLEKEDEEIDEPNVWVPSGAQTGLKLVSPFTVPVNAPVSLTIDFDLRKAIHTNQAQGTPNRGYDYRLRPALRLVDTSETGAIAGSVDNAINSEGCSFNDGDDPAGAAVYVYSGHDRTEGELGDVYVEDTSEGGDSDSTDQLAENEGGPVTVAPVHYAGDPGEYRYRAAFLNAGDYTVAFTCDASDDEPDVEGDTLEFGDPVEVTVTAGETTEANL